MNQTIRLSARAMPGIERTRFTYVSGNVCAKSTFGVLCEVTQRSASIWLIVSDALSIRPTKSPTCTKTSVTANATPETVIAKRSLSCSSDSVARSTAMLHQPAMFHQSIDERVDHQPRALLELPPLH